MRTTVDLPDDVYRQVKAKAALDGTSIKAFMLRAVETQLRAVRSSRADNRLPLIRSRRKKKLNLPGSQIDEILFG
jgi:hypothetical protein